MMVVTNPIKNSWAELLQRPSLNSSSLTNTVQDIINEVRKNGDRALLEYSKKWDSTPVTNLLLTEAEIESAANRIDSELAKAIDLAVQNIRTFHESQIASIKKIETTAGVECWRKSVGIDKVGLYVPGGTAPLFSSLLMLAIPAQLAACQEIVVCSPPNSQGTVEPALAYVIRSLGLNKVFKVGGAQAVAAMAIGTETIPKVYKIAGPGNQFVTAAKQQLQLNGLAIDMPAGPSEVLVIADESANAAFVAADLLSQAEHGADSQVVLCTTSEKLINEVQQEIEKQLDKLPRKEIAATALSNSRLIKFETLLKCFEFSNSYAPEHLILAMENAEEKAQLVRNAGSVFLGNYSCETAGDYASGTNHTLPTNGFARNYSGVSVDSFCKKITFQKISASGIKNLGPSLEKLAEAESLQAHKNAVSVRLKSLMKDA